MSFFSRIKDMFREKRGAELCRSRGSHRWGPDVYDGKIDNRWERYCCDCLHGQYREGIWWKDQRPDRVLGGSK